MAFDKPSDVMVMFGIFALVMLTVGLGVESLNSPIYQNLSEDTSYFTSIRSQTNDSYRTASTETGDALVTKEGTDDTPSENNIIVRSWEAVKSLGRAWNLIEGQIEKGSTKIGIPDYFWWILNAILVTIFAVVTYSWFRGAR